MRKYQDYEYNRLLKDRTNLASWITRLDYGFKLYLRWKTQYYVYEILLERYVKLKGGFIFSFEHKKFNELFKKKHGYLNINRSDFYDIGAVFFNGKRLKHAYCFLIKSQKEIYDDIEDRDKVLFNILTKEFLYEAKNGYWHGNYVGVRH